jgi:general secretion pathway protein K
MMSRPEEDHISSDKGIALMIVLWILTILMVIVFSFSYMARTETYSTFSFKNGTANKFLAEAGIERGILELSYRQFNQDMSVDIDSSQRWKIDGTPYQGQLDDGYYTVRITGEYGKVDINAASEVVLKNLFINLGIQSEEVDTIVDSIMDWKDPDNLLRLHGAESDYYQSLPNPYKAKDADFETVEELLLVKGMTPEILYGTNNRKGAINFLTVHSHQGGIDINAAPKEVLMALPGMSQELADSIIEYRKSKEIESPNEINLPPEALPYALFGGDGATYTIDAFGHQGSEKGGYAIRATVTISSDGTAKYVYYKSPAALQP